MQFVQFRPNRIAEGTYFRLWPAGGPWAFVLLALLGIALLLAVIAPKTWRASGLLASAVASLGALLFASGYAATHLTPSSDSIARVSLAGGAWVMLAGVAIVWFQGDRSVGRIGPRIVATAAAIAVTVAAFVFGGLGQLSLFVEYRTQGSQFWTLVGNHVVLSLAGTAIATVIGVPIGIAAARRRAVRATAIPISGLIQTIPSLALFGMLMIPLAALGLPTIGTLPALIALTLYALLPIIRNTYLGVGGVDPAIVDAGRGMGMSQRELLWRVELPLALPLLLEGLRLALVLTIGVAAVMAIGGAQDLGTLVFLGFGSQAADLTLLGALPMVVLAVIADQSMRALERGVVSPGIRAPLEAV
jgi:osmoprotectant transport system permease protein